MYKDPLDGSRRYRGGRGAVARTHTNTHARVAVPVMKPTSLKNVKLIQLKLFVKLTSTFSGKPTGFRGAGIPNANSENPKYR